MLRPQIAPLIRNMKVRDINVSCLLPTHEVDGEVAVGALTCLNNHVGCGPESTGPLQPLLLLHPPPAAGPAPAMTEMLQLFECRGDPHNGLSATSQEGVNSWVWTSIMFGCAGGLDARVKI